MIGMKKTPGVHVPPQLNRQLRLQFSEYMDNLLSFHEVLSRDDDFQVVDLGTYMEGYEE